MFSNDHERSQENFSNDQNSLKNSPSRVLSKVLEQN
jgi:hypothetical protein